MGTGWEHISFTHQGIGLRSYIDWKIKGSFYMNGGFEENYLSHLTILSSWKSSALLGISKKYTINTKLKGNIMILYDFLASHTFPDTHSIKLRFGYTLN